MSPDRSNDGFSCRHRAATGRAFRSARGLAVHRGGITLSHSPDRDVDLRPAPEPRDFAESGLHRRQDHLLAGFIVLMFALIALYGLQAPTAGRLGVVAFAVAIVGTMMLAGICGSSPCSPMAGCGTWSGGPDCSAIRHHGSWRHLELYPLCRRVDAVRGRQCAGRVFPLPISIAIILGIAGYRRCLRRGECCSV